MASIENSLQECVFLLGRAGAGKTFGCLAAIAEELRRTPRGLPLLLLTPEQSTAQLERRLATWPGLLGGMTRARVFSFNHLAREAFLRAGGAPGQTLGEVGRVMLLRQALRRRQPELTVLGQSSSQPGVAETVGRALLELQRYGWRLGELESWIAGQITSAGEQSLTVRKMRDLAILWRDYEAALAAGGWDDPAGLYPAAAAAIRGSDWLAGARIWVDGFASFTAQEQTVLEALLEQSSQAVFALCLDPEQLALKERAGGLLRPRIGTERMFENIEETYRLLRERVKELGLREDQIRVKALPAAGQPTRAADSPALAHLERRVLGRMVPEVCPDAVWECGTNHGTPIELIEAGDRRAEVEAVARRIVLLCRRAEDDSAGRPLLLWREVAVLGRDLAPYEIHLREIFRAFEIPFFLDRPRSVHGHPLARSILSALAVLRSGWAGGVVLHHLKSGMCGLEDEDAIGQLENAIRATDPAGAGWLRGVEGDELLGPAWRRAAAPLRRLEADLRAVAAPRAIWNYLEATRAAARLEAWTADARERGDEETVQLHEQAWEQTVAWLEEFDKIEFKMQNSKGKIDFQEVIEIVEAALASTEARLIPPTLNQVTVGSVDRSRTPEVRVLFVIGLSDGEFPKMWQPDAMLGDEERSELTRGGRRLGPDTQAKRLQEHFLAYIALTRSSGRLVLSRAQVDDDGRACDPSPYFTLVARCFPRAPVVTVKRAGEGESAALPLRPEEWALRLAEEMNRTDPEESDGLERFSALTRHPGLAAGQAAGLKKAWGLLRPQTAPRLGCDLARAFWGAGAMLSATSLEHYGECPFKFFAQRMLRLSERKEATLNIQELGTLRHELLDRLFRALRAPEGLDWGKLDLAAADRAVDEQLGAIRQEDAWRPRLEASALGGLTLEELGAEIKLFARALRQVGERGRFVQVESEWTFGEGGELVAEAGGLRFAIRGTIDRIDVAAEPNAPPAGLLIDYKSGQRRLNLARILAGIDLQLPVYALAWQRAEASGESAGRRIGGIFYWPLAAPVREAEPDDSEAAEAVDARWFEKQKPSGIFDSGLAELLDGKVGPGGSSLAFGFQRKNDGEVSKVGQNAWPGAMLRALLEYEERLLAKMAERIIEGRIETSPFALGKTTACQKCDFAAICRKADPVPIPQRRLEKIGREKAIELLQNES